MFLIFVKQIVDFDIRKGRYMTNPKISVIIPVYNMRDFIEEAINSILSQTLTDTEIVCMDDCSTDDTADVIKRLADAYENVHYFKNDINYGVGKTRADAMKYACGEYLFFIDADDRLPDNDVFEKLYNAASDGDCDICGGLVSNFSESEKDDYTRFREMFKDSEQDAYVDLDFKDIQDDYFFQGFIYRRSFLEKHDITFPDLRAFEDPVFLVKALYYANRIRALNKEVYAHRFDHKERKPSIDALKALFRGVLINLDFAEEHGLDDLYEKTLNRVTTDFIFYIIPVFTCKDEEAISLLYRVGNKAEEKGYSYRPFELLSYMFDQKDLLMEFFRKENMI